MIGAQKTRSDWMESEQIAAKLTDLEERFGTTQVLRELDEKLKAIQHPPGWKDPALIAAASGLIAALISGWFAYQATQSEKQQQQDFQLANNEKETKMAALNTELELARREHEKELTDLRATVEMRINAENADVELLKLLTPSLLSTNRATAARALSIAGALRRSTFETLATGLSTDKELAATVTVVRKSRAARFDGRAVTCDRASNETRDKSPDKAGSYDVRCRGVRVVKNIGREPHIWQSGLGLTFVAFKDNETEIWCSCRFENDRT